MNFLRRTWAEIDLDALCANINQIRAAAGGKKLIAVVKANAYGHDDEIICTALFDLGVDTFAVSNIWEGEELRKILPAANIIIFGYTEEAYFDSITENRFIITVGSTDFARRLNSFAEQSGTKINVHVKIDTGMSRIGIDSECELCEILSLKNLSVNALCTHLAVSDSDGDDDYAFTCSQYERIRAVAGKFSLPYHTQNSGGVLFHPDFGGDFVRAGLAIFGYAPGFGTTPPFPLKPVMSLKSCICQLKTIKKGASVSYGRTYTAPADLLAAVIPVGYADGYKRALSNKGKVLIHGVLCSIIGRVCMDQIVVDVTNVPEIAVGDVAEIYSDKNTETTIEYIADILDTIPYEITCSIGHRVPRVAVRGGKTVKVVRYGIVI